MEPDNADSFNFGDSPIVLAISEGKASISFGRDTWKVPAADLYELVAGLKHLGYEI